MTTTNPTNPTVPPAEDWSDGPIGYDHGYADIDEFEESMEHGRHTIAGIIERADVLTGSGGSLEQFRSEVKHLTEESLEVSK